MNIRYRNFDVEIYEYEEQETSESFSVRVTNSPAGDQSPSQAERMTMQKELRQTTVSVLDGTVDTQNLIAYGSAIADCILPFGVRQLMLSSIRLLKEDEALRIRLKFDAWQLASIPWEYVYISRSSVKGINKEIDGFLALDRRISITRYEYTDHPPSSFDQESDTAVRQLVLLASPPDFPSLDLELEAKIISESLQSITNVTIDFLNSPTIEDLQDALENPAHIFHFSGHGGFMTEAEGDQDKSGGKGIILLFGTEDTSAQAFVAEKLAINLTRCGVRVAFLNTNYSAARDTFHRLSGVASALAYAGIPAVIGYNGAVTDKSSIIFARAFYRTLASGSSIDTAVTNGRLAILNRPDIPDYEWGCPVLYLRADDITVFPIKPKVQKSAEPKMIGINKLALRDMLVQHFNKEELDGLCFEINGSLIRDGIQQRVDLDIVGGDTLSNISLNLIQHLERRGLLNYLIDAVAAQRPNLQIKGKE